MFSAIYLPKLNQLSPTLDSTLLKIMEEAGELSRAVLAFLPYENLSPQEIAALKSADSSLRDVAQELLDTAQTCVTMIFVLEEQLHLKVDNLVAEHLHKLIAKGYVYKLTPNYRICSKGEYKYLMLPRLEMPQVTLLTTVCKIQEELGELAQVMGKFSGRSGEKWSFDTGELNRLCAFELLDVAQCCCTMMYLLGERYSVDMDELMALHVDKLRRRGYFC